MPSSAVPVTAHSRPSADEQAFRDAHRLVLAFGLSAIPATLLLIRMGGDVDTVREGIPFGTIAMWVAGSVSVVALASYGIARRAWKNGATLSTATAILWRPLLLILTGLLLAMLAFTTEFLWLLERT